VKALHKNRIRLVCCTRKESSLTDQQLASSSSGLIHLTDRTHAHTRVPLLQLNARGPARKAGLTHFY